MEKSKKLDILDRRGTLHKDKQFSTQKHYD